VRAVTIRDGAIVVDEQPDPSPGDGHVLVRVRAAGVNGADFAQLAGTYPPPPGSPADIPGLELAGEIVAIGHGVCDWSVGDRVMALTGGGSQAELAVVHERLLLRVPEELSWSKAGGFVEAYATAHDAIFTQGGLRVGERLLVNGAAGGVGTAAVQLARAAGASVTASVRNPALHQQVAALGAVVCAPNEVPGHGPFDVVLELVGAPNIPPNLDVLAPEGRILVIGVSAGRRTELDLFSLMRLRARIHGSTLRTRSLEEKALVTRLVERHVLPLLVRGEIDVLVEQTFPLAEAQAAYARFTAGGKLGKIVLAND
jgi:NADPH2:quinone reductase